MVTGTYKNKWKYNPVERQQKLTDLRLRLKSASDSDKKNVFSTYHIHNINTGKDYSISNTYLMHIQKPDVFLTIVGTYTQWQTAGRQVLKGEKCMYAWQPIGENKDDDTGLILNPTRFILVKLFDISQTMPIDNNGNGHEKTLNVNLPPVQPITNNNEGVMPIKPRKTNYKEQPQPNINDIMNQWKIV